MTTVVEFGKTCSLSLAWSHISPSAPPPPPIVPLRLKWNVGRVTNMNEMFKNAHTFDIDLSPWNISLVNSMDEMFYSATKFTQTLCWDTQLLSSASMFLYSASGSASVDAPKCLCAAGSFYDGDECVACTPFDYSFGETEACGTCPAGKYTNGAGARPPCVVCEPGKYGDDGTGACTECEAGKYSSASGLTVPCSQTCPPGTHSAAGATSCTTCVAGQFAVYAGSSFCTHCLAGRYSSVIGRSTSCSDVCSAGTFSLEGSSECTTCAAGKYQIDAEKSYCLSCFGGNRLNRCTASELTLSYD